MHAIAMSRTAVPRGASAGQAAALAVALALATLLSLPASAEPPQFEDAQEVLAQRPDGTWQRAMIDGKFDGKGYPVQFMEPPYGHEVLPPERIRIDPEKGTLAEQLARAFPEIPKWTGLLAVRTKDGRPHWAHLTAQRGSILKIAWDDGSGRQQITHKDILERRTPTPEQVAAAELARERALHMVERRCDRQGGRPAREDLSIGYHVKALDRDDGRWYRARIRTKSGDAYEIAWEDGVDPDEYHTGCELNSP
jgi:hypothetical protein